MASDQKDMRAYHVQSAGAIFFIYLLQRPLEISSYFNPLEQMHCSRRYLNIYYYDYELFLHIY
jgi:hypothetical protein